MRVDQAKAIAHAGAFRPFRQLFLQSTFLIRRMGKRIFKRSVFFKKLACRLFPYAGDTRQIIGAVAHQALQIRHTRRHKAVLLH